MDQLNYQPDVMARGLAGRSTGFLALLLPTDEAIADSFMVDIIVAAAETARERGYHLLLWTEPAGEPEGPSLEFGASEPWLPQPAAFARLAASAQALDPYSGTLNHPPPHVHAQAQLEAVVHGSQSRATRSRGTLARARAWM